MTTKPVTRSTGGTVTAATENTVDDYWATSIDSIRNANIPSGAGITSDKIADRYGCFPLGPVSLVPWTSGTDLSAPASFTLPTSALTVFKHTVRWHSSKKLFLYYVEFYVGIVSANGVKFSTYVNSTLLGNAGIAVTASDTTAYLRNSTHAANPLATLSDGDTLRIDIEDSAGAATGRGVTGMFWLKPEMGS